MALVRQLTSWSWPEIGKYFDKDESSVRAAVEKVMSDDELGSAVASIAKELSPPQRLFALSDAEEKAL